MYKFLVLLSIVLIVSCKHDPFPYDGPPIDPGDTTNPPPTTRDCSDSVYFQPTILNLLNSSCGQLGCHDIERDSTDKIVLTNYNDIMDEVKEFDPSESDLYKVLVESDPEDRMPPPQASPLTNEQIELIRQWILEGAKDNECFECDTNTISYQTSVRPILENSCTNCHGQTPSGGASQSLTTKQLVIDAINNYKLLERIQRIGGVTPMPQNVALDDCSIRTIVKWKEKGYPD